MVDMSLLVMSIDAPASAPHVKWEVARLFDLSGKILSRFSVCSCAVAVEIASSEFVAAEAWKLEIAVNIKPIAKANEPLNFAMGLDDIVL